MLPIKLQSLRNSHFGRVIQYVTSLFSRRWPGLGPAGLVAFIGLVIYAIGRILVPADQPVGAPLRLAGFLLALGGLLLWGKSRIRRTQQKDRRSALWAAWWTAATGGLIVVGAAILLAVGRPLGTLIAGVGILVLAVGPLCAYLFVSLAPASRTFGAAGFTQTVFLLAVFGLELPASIILLIAGEPPAYWVGPQTNSPIETILEVAIPYLLILPPRLVSPWKSAPKDIRENLPTLLADLATGLTILYVLSLHWLGGSLKTIPLDKLAVAIVFVVALLRPVYKVVVVQCWKSELLKTLTLYEWRQAQLKLVHKIREEISNGATVSDRPGDSPLDERSRSSQQQAGAIHQSQRLVAAPERAQDRGTAVDVVDDAVPADADAEPAGGVGQGD